MFWFLQRCRAYGAAVAGVLSVVTISKRFLCLSASQAFVNIVPMPVVFDAVFARAKELVADFRVHEPFYLSAQFTVKWFRGILA